MPELVLYWRNPTASEVKFGYGTIHFAEFTLDECGKDGKPRKWFIYQGHRYNKV